MRRFPSVSAQNTFTGTRGNDDLVGTQGSDTLYGLAGRDTLQGGDSRDWLFGGNGADLLEGGDGDDWDMMGGKGNDTLLGGAGDDSRMFGEDGDDWLDGGSGDDALQGGSGHNTLLGGEGDDALFAGGADSVDWLDGGNGHDFFYLTEYASATVQGGSGQDSLWAVWNGLKQDVLWNIDADGSSTVLGYDINSVESFEVWLGDGNDQIDLWLDLASGSHFIGNGGHDRIDTHSVSADLILEDGTTGWGNDTLISGSGADQLKGEYGADWLQAGAGDDAVLGGYGDDTLLGEAGQDKLWGGKNNDWIDGGDGNDLLHGGDGHDSLWGGAGDDTLLGGNRSDWLRGGAGNDLINCGSGWDTVVLDGQGVDTVLSSMGAHIFFAMSSLSTGNGDTVVDEAVYLEPGDAFSTASELVVLGTGVPKGSLLDVSWVATHIGSASQAYSVGDTRLFIVNDTQDSAIYSFSAQDADANISAQELSLLATLDSRVDSRLSDIWNYQFMA